MPITALNAEMLHHLIFWDSPSLFGVFIPLSLTMCRPVLCDGFPGNMLAMISVFHFVF